MTPDPDVPHVDEIRNAVRQRFAEVSCSAEGKCRYPTGKTGAEALGYDPRPIREAPDVMMASFCGVGNPFSLGEIRLGEAVLDVGCGAGFDIFCASRLVGTEGNVCGIDITPEMVEKAKANLVQAGVSNTEVQVGNSEDIPFDDNTFDVVTSNGVLNMSPLKKDTYREILRVLKPDGRLQFADLVLRGDLAPEDLESLDAWSQ